MDEFDNLRQTWTELGDVDPLWAILSDPKKEGGKWDVATFFGSGEVELADVLAQLARLRIAVTFGTALDFGCGVGRVTQAMSRRFEHSHGVDVAESMIDQAERFNAETPRCTYHHNPRPDLTLFPDDTFDFIYSRIVLQHMAPELATSYVREFLRVLEPGGVAVFQVPAEQRPVPLAPGQSRSQGPLPDEAFRANVDLVTPRRWLLRLRAGMPKRITVRAYNLGPVTWPAVGTPDGRFWVRVANQWLLEDRSVVHRDDARADLPVDVRPGESVKVRLRITPPATPGRYRLALDVVQEGVCWFHDEGSTATEIPVAVGDNPAAAEPDPVSATKPRFEMHGVPRARVEAVIAGGGGRAVAVLPDESAGDAWVSWLYVVTKEVAADAGSTGAQE